MKIILPILTALIVGVASFYFFQKHISEQKLDYKIQKLRIAEKCVQQKLDQLSEKISRQLNAFAETVAGDKNFALRVLAGKRSFFH
jgi:uncharacterized protein YxeA